MQHAIVELLLFQLLCLCNMHLGIGQLRFRRNPKQTPRIPTFVLWDSNARINGLVAVDLETLVLQGTLTTPRT